MKKNKLICTLLILAMLTAILAGCAGTEQAPEAEQSAPVEEAPVEETPAPSQEAPAPAEEAPEAPAEEAPEAEEPEAPTGFTPVAYEFPLVEETETLGYFTTVSPNFSAYMESYDTNESVIAMEELTGVHIEYQCFIPENAQTQFNLMSASGTLPDITLGATEYYSGGMDKAVSDEILLNMADYLDYCPNYSALLESDSYMRNSLTTDSGNLKGFASYTDPAIATPVSGSIMVRGDWLEKVNMEVPTTYDEVHEVLTAFKNELGVESPMLVNSYLDDMGGSFASGFDIKAFFMTSPGIQVPFYVIDGQVKCAIVEENFVSYIEMLQSYMAEGLLAKDIESYSNERSYMELVTSGEVGFFWGFGVNNLATLNQQVEEGGYFKAVPAIRKTEDQALHFTTTASYQARSCVNLTTNCADVELACKWLDCHYTEEVSMLSMYGVEGVSYTLNAAGEPEYTDLLLNNPDGITLESCKALYTLSPADNVSYNYINTNLATYSPEQLEALEVINAGELDGDYVYPTGASLTAEEDEVYSGLIADLSTYMAEHVLKFVTGNEPMEDYPAFIEALGEIGIDEAIALKQAAYDRYIAR